MGARSIRSTLRGHGLGDDEAARRLRALFVAILSQCGIGQRDLALGFGVSQPTISSDLASAEALAALVSDHLKNLPTPIRAHRPRTPRRRGADRTRG